MSEAFDVKLVSVEIGALSNDLCPLVKIPTDAGGLTILDVNFTLRAAGTTGLHLVDLGTSGTAVAGTLYSKGSAVYVANAPQAGTLVTAFVPEGHWIGVKEDNSGAANAVTHVEFSFVWGKAG